MESQVRDLGAGLRSAGFLTSWPSAIPPTPFPLLPLSSIFSNLCPMCLEVGLPPPLLPPLLHPTLPPILLWVTVTWSVCLYVYDRSRIAIPVLYSSWLDCRGARWFREKEGFCPGGCGFLFWGAHPTLVKHTAGKNHRFRFNQQHEVWCIPALQPSEFVILGQIT